MSYSTQGFSQGSSVGGEWELVERWVPTTASTSYTFSGLNGDRDRRYKIVSRFISNYGSQISINASFNSDTAAANYPLLNQYTSGSNVSLFRSNNYYYGCPIGNVYSYKYSEFESIIHSSSGTGRMTIIHGSLFDSDSSNLDTNKVTSVWTNTSDNITQLVLTARENATQANVATNGIGVGTYVELWRLKQNNQISSGEWNLVERWEPSVATTSYTFSGLNGDRDRRYKIVSRLKSANSTAAIQLQPNADSTSANYNIRYKLAAGGGNMTTSYQNNAGMYLGICENTNTSCFADCIIDAMSGSQRTYIASSLKNSSTLANIEGQDWIGQWNNTTDNIISIVVNCTTANGIDVGSYVELWKLSQ